MQNKEAQVVIMPCVESPSFGVTTSFRASFVTDRGLRMQHRLGSVTNVGAMCAVSATAKSFTSHTSYSFSKNHRLLRHPPRQKQEITMEAEAREGQQRRQKILKRLKELKNEPHKIHLKQPPLQI